MAAKTHTGDKKLDELVVTFADALRDQNAAVFAGAGLSVPAGFVNWKELMRSIADDLGLSVDREHDLIAVAQYHQNERGGRHRINQLLIEEFVQGTTLTENHQILARLPIGTFWTTNYDDLLEKALLEAGKSADVKITTQNLATNRPKTETGCGRLQDAWRCEAAARGSRHEGRLRGVHHEAAIVLNCVAG